ncbi:MAG: DUF1697 domain-containing protein [Clostridiales bacterium]|nr:DUF1697 domain-containing protein [Clostridiales bacterium]
MNRYIALLRGINISGKNKISMSELKASFLALGYKEVLSYLNSGNIIFCCNAEDKIRISSDIRLMINKEFELDIPVLVILQNELKTLLDKKPDWWESVDKEWYDNLIFVMPTSSAEEIAEKVGDPTADLERISVCERYIFWSFDRKKYSKANWWRKTASSGIGELLTIRTANTLKKIAHM